MPLQKGEQLGPGGLDPAEVFETLPRVMQEAFGSREVEELKKALTSMPADDAQYHMKRCIDSGLWDPAGGGGGDDDDEEGEAAAEGGASAGGASAEVDD